MGKNKGDSFRKPDADALSLHSQHAAAPVGSSSSSNNNNNHPQFNGLDNDALDLLTDDLPPLYSDIEADGGPVLEAEGERLLQMNDQDRHIVQEIYQKHSKGEGQKTRSYVMTEVADEQYFVKSMVDYVASLPPRPFVRLLGTHTERVTRDNKQESKKVVDFDVKLELTPYLYADVQRHQNWRDMHLPYNHERVRRGTVFARAEKNGADATGQDEEGQPLRPSLEEWCQRFVADPSSLKCFSVKRQTTGFDNEKIRAQMEMLVRRTNYRGHLSIEFPTNEKHFDIYSRHRFNVWRLSRWIQVLCVLTLTIIFTWPFLFFRTKRYEVVRVDWPFSRINMDNGRKEYISLSEDQIYNLWARAITKAVLSKRQGTLDQEDLRASEGAEETFNSGNNVVDGAVNIFQAGINAMNHVNRQLGWGYDN